MMSLTYTTDMFYSRLKRNELDPMQGKRYRECILEFVGSKGAIELLKAYLSREPSIEALLANIGLNDGVQLNKITRMIQEQ